MLRFTKKSQRPQTSLNISHQILWAGVDTKVRSQYEYFSQQIFKIQLCELFCSFSFHSSYCMSTQQYGLFLFNLKKNIQCWYFNWQLFNTIFLFNAIQYQGKSQTSLKSHISVSEDLNRVLNCAQIHQDTKACIQWKKTYLSMNLNIFHQILTRLNYLSCYSC